MQSTGISIGLAVIAVAYYLFSAATIGMYWFGAPWWAGLAAAVGVMVLLGIAFAAVYMYAMSVGV